MTDTLNAVTSIQSWISGIQTTMATLPASLSGSVESGDFASVLAGVQSALDGGAGSSTSPAGTVPAATSASTGGVTGEAVVSQATSYLGVPYVWGGTSPSGFDCSGFTQYVYGQLGISLPRTSEQQATVGEAVPSLADAEPGDLVFYAGSDGTASSPGHVGIYVGNGQMIDAPETGQSVSIQPVGNPVAIRRVLPEEAGGSSLDSTLNGSGSQSVPAALAPYFLNAAATYGVPAQLLTSVARVESNFNVNAQSSAGAEGIMQLMPETAASLGVNPLDPAQAIDGAAQLLSGYINQFGSVPLALAAYNAGPGAVESYQGIPPYKQTQNYVSEIMQMLGSSATASASGGAAS